MMAKVLRVGPQASVQDLGRVGHRAIGVGTSGALDPFAGRVANLLVGNDEGAALIEIALGNFRLRLEDERLITWCGGDFDVEITERKVPAGHTYFVGAGEEIAIMNAKTGCRAWLAISGGIDVPRVLESRSTDLRAAFGGFNGRSLRGGDELALGELPVAGREWMVLLREARLSSWSAPRAWASTSMHHSVLRFIRGTDWKDFCDQTHQALAEEKFTATQEAVTPGTLQVPPNGKPILLLGDCQTIGGYPKIAHVITVDLPIAAQLRPGNAVRFREVSLEEAYQLFFERERELERFQIGLSLRT